ncbi:hypothetical protein [Pseudophaeobacter sp. C1-32P7]|uniref:hypothetical protein n=1 Tax=Pseudophaeobacter sp. C1-32P7 TaxID=3098142 RepID=UPI0034D48F40
MTQSFLSRCAAASAVIALTAGPVLAQSAPVLYTVIVPAGEFGSAAFLRQLVTSLSAAKAFCADIDAAEYRVDCLAERLESVSAEIPEDSDYEEVRQVLRDTARDIHRLTRKNRDWKQSNAYASRKTSSTDRTTRPLTPVNPARAAQVNQQASAILDQAQTVLLRSAEAAEERRSQYVQIAEALGSNKVLLRS